MKESLESDILCKKGAAHLYERLPRSPKNCVGLDSLNPLFPAYANGSIPLLSQREKVKGAVGLWRGRYEREGKECAEL